VSAEKEGYVVGSETVTTLETASVDLVLEKLSNLTYDIMIVDTEGNVRSPEDDEALIVTLTEEGGYTTTAYYPSESSTVLLIPGVYQVEGEAVGESSFNIDVDPTAFTKCSSVPQISLGGLFGLGDSSCTDVTTKAESVDMALFGGVKSTWNLGRYELQDAGHITFYVTSPGKPENEDEVSDVYSYVDTGMGFKEPELS
jgi:hypothetical protein